MIFLMTALTAAQSHAARSSSRNFKSLKQQQEERIATEQEAQRIARESARSAGRAAADKPVENVKFLGPKTGWGFVSRTTAHYSPEGRNLGELKAGTLFKYQDIRPSSRNDMLLSMLRDAAGWRGPFLLPCTEVAAYEGDPETVDIQIVADLRQYFLLKGEYDTLREELLDREYRKNPHFAEYEHSVRAYQESTERAAELEKSSAGLSGAARTRAYEELRELKYRQERLKGDLQRIGDQYRVWKERNPVDLAEAENAPMRALRQKMDAIQSRVPELIPGEG